MCVCTMRCSSSEEGRRCLRRRWGYCIYAADGIAVDQNRDGYGVWGEKAESKVCAMIYAGYCTLQHTEKGEKEESKVCAMIYAGYCTLQPTEKGEMRLEILEDLFYQFFQVLCTCAFPKRSCWGRVCPTV